VVWSILLLALLGGVGAALLALLVWTRRRAIVVTLAGRSMEPTFFAGDRVLVRRASLAEIGRNDVVLVHLPPPPDRHHGVPPPPGGFVPMVKRVAAVPGDAAPPGYAAAGVRPGDVVPAGRLLLIGDNRLMSYDSRQLGYVDATAVVGVVTGKLSR
jgi:signal peptidase I